MYCCALMEKLNRVNTYTSEQPVCICKHPEAHHKMVGLWVQSSVQVYSGVTLFKEQVNTFKLTECVVNLNFKKKKKKKTKNKRSGSLQWNLVNEFMELIKKTLSVKPLGSIPTSHNQWPRKLYWFSGILPCRELKSSPFTSAFYSNLPW